MVAVVLAMLDTILDYLRTPLLILSGKQVTILTLMTALAIIIGARIIATVLGRSLDRLFSARGIDHGLRFALGKIIRYAVTIIGVIVALGTCGIDTSAVMAGGAVLLVGIGFGLQKLAENFISGLLLLVERPVRKGDYIDVGGVLGTVEDIGLRATHVITQEGIVVIVPNANLVSGVVINHTVPSRTRRMSIKFNVAYGTDLDLLQQTQVDAVSALVGVWLEGHPPEVRIDAFGDSSIQVSVVVWIVDAREEAILASRIRFCIERTCRENKITMPFPQREIRMLSA